MGKKLNIGCGDNKLKDYINLDVNSAFEPDICIDIRLNPLPLDDSSCSRVVMFHTIEHIEKKYWPFIFDEINRVLESKGQLIIAFPNFEEVSKLWLENNGVDRDFLENVIYGRQASDADYHVSLCTPTILMRVLLSHGFSIVETLAEKEDEFNVSMLFRREFRTQTREDLLNRTVFGKNDYI